jgi:hypothetical protein
MTFTIELTPEETNRLQRAAQARGLDVSALLRRLIAHLPEDAFEDIAPTWGAQVLAEWEREGVIGYRTDIADSQAHARVLRETAQRRERE